MIERLQRIQDSPTFNIALIHPPIKNQVQGVASVPLGLAWLASWLELHGYNVKCFDLSVNKLARADLSCNIFSVICIQLHSEERFEESLQYLIHLRQKHPSSLIIAGGLVASLKWEKVASDEAVDILVCGEGEIPLLELINALASTEIKINWDCLFGIKGLVFKYNEQLIFTGKPEVIKDLDELPFPNRSLFSPQKYSQWSLITSRGCPYGCSFCTIPLLYKGQCRLQSANSIYHEICALQNDYHIEQFVILDDTFTIERKRVINLCNKIIDGKNKFSWSCLTRADKVDRELLEILASAGCRQISYGIESINQSTLDRLNKRLSKQHIENALHLTKEYGMRRRASFIFGLPGEHYSDIMKSINFICDVLPEEIQIYPLMPYYGLPILTDEDVLKYTPLCDVPKYKKNAFHPLVNTKSISEKELRELLMICIKKLREKGYLWIPGDMKAGKYGIEKIIMTEFCPAQLTAYP